MDFCDVEIFENAKIKMFNVNTLVFNTTNKQDESLKRNKAKCFK